MSDPNTFSNKKSRKFWRWKQNKDRKRNAQNNFSSTSKFSGLHKTSPHNGATFTPTSAWKFKPLVHPQVSPSSTAAASASKSNAALQSQVTTSSSTQHNGQPTTSAHNLVSFATIVTKQGKPRTPTDLKKDSFSTMAGPSGQSSFKTSATYTGGQVSTTVPSKYLAIDCEMVGTGPKGHISQLGRCSLVSYEGDVVYDKFVSPSEPVTDYRTRWSGIRRCDLIGATPYAQARKEILKLLAGKVLIGHAIHNDFKALSYFHPKALIRDTSRIPLLNQKAGFAEKQVVSLKRLTKAIFDRDIQTGKKGHSSVEDAKATMELYKVVEVEWEKKLASTMKTQE